MSVVSGAYAAQREEQQLYIGVDSACGESAVFSLDQKGHRNRDGLMHQMMPLTQFKRTINQKKFKMADKVATLVEDYCKFMDNLITQINELKLNKSVELNMLWLRELASNEQEYETLRRLYWNDYSGLSCRDVHNLYFKVVSNSDLEAQAIEQIPCYADIAKIMSTLTNSVKGQLMITQKVAELQGVVQKGELLRRALPDRRVLREHTKQILLESHSSESFDIRYNRAVLTKGSRHYQSLFSKYPLLPHTNYHLLLKNKYSNVMVGVCGGQTRKQPAQATDLHYHAQSLTYNCSNGCLYRDGMFESGSAGLTKGAKELELILRITDEEMLLLLGKNVVCRTNLIKQDKIYLHALLRTEKDSVEIDRDIISNSEQPQLNEAPPRAMNDSMKADYSLPLNPNSNQTGRRGTKQVRFKEDSIEPLPIVTPKVSQVIDKPAVVSVHPPSDSRTSSKLTPDMKSSRQPLNSDRGKESIVLGRQAAIRPPPVQPPTPAIDFLKIISPIPGPRMTDSNRPDSKQGVKQSLVLGRSMGIDDSANLGRTQMMKTNRADNSNINIIMEKSLWSEDIRDSKGKDQVESQFSPDFANAMNHSLAPPQSSLIPPLKRTQFDSPSLRDSDNMKVSLQGPVALGKKASGFESPRDLRKTQNNDEWL